MQTSQSIAIEAFRGGLNCSQAVLLSYTDQLNIDKGMAMSIACGFGAGMGRLQETCGAVTGSFMVLSVYACKKNTENAERKEKSYELIQEFKKRFVALNGSAKCRDILNCDLQTAEGRQYAAEKNLFRTTCEKCITDSVDIIEELIAD